MRHGKKFNHLSRKAPHRKAMLANMACSLIEHKRIKTTVAKAKALRVYIEPLLTKSKEDTTHSRRTVFSYLKQKQAITELFGDVAAKIADRPGGYTRILKLSNRLGDNAEMCFIELVDYNEDYTTDKPKRKKTRRRGAGKSSELQTSEVVTETTTIEEIAETITDGNAENVEGTQDSGAETTEAEEAEATTSTEEVASKEEKAEKTITEESKVEDTTEEVVVEEKTEEAESEAKEEEVEETATTQEEVIEEKEEELEAEVTEESKVEEAQDTAEETVEEEPTETAEEIQQEPQAELTEEKEEKVEPAETAENEIEKKETKTEDTSEENVVESSEEIIEKTDAEDVPEPEEEKDKTEDNSDEQKKDE